MADGTGVKQLLQLALLRRLEFFSAEPCARLRLRSGASGILRDDAYREVPAPRLFALPPCQRYGPGLVPAFRVRAREEGRDLLGRSVFFNDTATTEIYTLSLHDALLL